MELCSKAVALNYPFEVVERYKPPIPESLQLRIAFWSFPDNEEEIRLYSCLSCGSNEKYKMGEILAKTGNVCDVLQIGGYIFEYFINLVLSLKFYDCLYFKSGINIIT